MADAGSVEECRYAFRAAWRCIASHYTDAPVFVRELLRTARCDAHHDLSRLRGAVERDLGVGAVQRLQQYGETVEDRRRAHQAVVHHGRWAREELAKALNVWPHEAATAWLLG